VVPGRDVAEDADAARAGEELQGPLGHPVVGGAEVFQLRSRQWSPYGRKDRVCPLSRRTVLARLISSGGGTWNPAARRGPRIFLCRRCLSACDSSDPGWAGSVNGMP
jgi:hypothetical protein